MSLDVEQFLVHIVRPVLNEMQGRSGLPLAGDRAEVLLLATAAQESNYRYLRQLGGGPARGLFQMEPPTYQDTVNRCQEFWPALNESLLQLRRWHSPFREHEWDEMVGNMEYAVGMARAKYWLVPKALPAASDLAGQWAYYKRWWNSELGAATEEEFRENFARYVAPVLRAA